MHIPPCSIKLNTFKSFMMKCVNITYATVSLGRLFSFCYQHQVITLMVLWKFRIVLPDCFNLVNQTWYTDQKIPSSQNKVSLAWCQLCDVISAVHYCTGVDIQSPNKRVLSLTWCQQIYVRCAVHYFT